MSFFRWREGIVVGCLNLMNKIVLSFTEEIILDIFRKEEIKAGYLGRTSSIATDEDLCLLFIKQDLLVCFHCYGVPRPH